MALETAFQDLQGQFQKLRDVLFGLHMTVIEDRPLQDDVALVDKFGDAAADLLGWLQEALTAATEGQQAVGHPTDVNQARRALTICQERFNRVTHRFSTDLMSYERIAELVSLGSERQGEWPTWTSSVKEGLDRCQQPFYDVNQALFLCWQEIAERVGMNSVSVQTKSVGQQIYVVPE